MTLSQLQGDIACLLERLREPEEGRQFWRSYQKWDGAAPLHTRLEMKDGQCFQVSVSVCPDQAADLFMFYRITEEYQRENEYLQKLTKAEEASQFKTSFLFRMSHEIRTPINGITGTLMLAESKLPEGHEAMQYLSNAVKFTEKGEITVTFRQMLTQAGRVDFLIRVHDTGIGMQPEFIDCIFHPFEQEESGAAAAELQEELLPGKVLLAEDNELNAMIVVEILQSRGLKVDVAEIPIYALSADAFVEE